MSRKLDDIFDELHALTAGELVDILKNGAVHPETGERIKASPQYFSAAIRFLKDNDITVDKEAGRLDAVEDAVSDIPDFDEDFD